MRQNSSCPPGYADSGGRRQILCISSVQTYKEWTIMQKTNNLQDIFLTKARKENVGGEVLCYIY